MRILSGKCGWYFGREEPLAVHGPFKTWQDASEARIRYYGWVARRVEYLKGKAERDQANRRRQVRIGQSRGPLRVTLGEMLRAA